MQGLFIRNILRRLAFITTISSPISNPLKTNVGILSSVKPDEEVREATWTRQSECESIGE